MPKPTKEELSAKISQLEQELRNYPDSLLLDDDDEYAFPSGSGAAPDADFFDIEMDAGIIDKDKKNRKTDISRRGKDFKPYFFPRGRIASRGRGRGRGFFKTMYRGKYVPSFVPQDSQIRVTQNLYNDDEDWSRYVSQSIGREAKVNEEFSKSPPFEDDIMNLMYGSRKDYKDKRKVQESKDMFYFPNEGPDKKNTLKSESKNKIETKSKPEAKNKIETKSKPESKSSGDSETNRSSDVLSIFQQLQSKLSSTGEEIAGLDVLAETLKKLEKLNDNKSSKDLPPDKSELRKEDKEQSSSNYSQKSLSPSRKLSYSSSKAKPISSSHKHDNSPSYKREDNKHESSPVRKREEYNREISPAYKRDDHKREREEYKHESSPPLKRESSPHKRESSPLRRDCSPSYKRGEHKRDISPLYKHEEHRRDLSPSRKRNLSPYRKREISPPGKKEISSYKRRSPVSPSRRRPISPARRRRSPSPTRRRRSPSPSFRRRPPSDSPHTRREVDIHARRSPRRRRSRSRSPRKDSYRRSSSPSRSPRRSDYRSSNRKRKGSGSPITLSPSPERIGDNWRKSSLGSKTWYPNKPEFYNPPTNNSLLQPIPPAGDTSDAVYAEVMKLN